MTDRDREESQARASNGGQRAIIDLAEPRRRSFIKTSFKEEQPQVAAAEGSLSLCRRNGSRMNPLCFPHQKRSSAQDLLKNIFLVLKINVFTQATESF